MRQTLGTVLALAAAAGAASAESLDRDTIQYIYGTAILMCGDYNATGSASKSDTDIRNSLDALSETLEEKGYASRQTTSSTQYVGLLREQLGAEFSDVRTCRLEIWNDLMGIVGQAFVATAPVTAPVPAALPDFSGQSARYTPSEAAWFVIMGSFPDRAGAERRLREITGLGLLPAIIRTGDYPNLRNGYYSVVTPVGSRQSAQEMLSIARTQVPDAYIKSPW
ncbi:SPOR domain-containing protein [Poseidonocella sp. HB161398]|uniref:SPOR domain-containing protein n=1 Tax=Poseidonocella sp. HB161398 TaxID=2320855 RepID=UPI001107CC04|nr:SPOR domain-containing protein [Poseidonocella sp. HB161398]